MGKTTKIRWLDEPEEKDYGAAESFLSLLVAPGRLPALIGRLRRSPLGEWRAKDVLRASGLPPLRPKASAEVAEKLGKIKAGKALSPILLVGGLNDRVVIADGYHRASAAYGVDEDAMVPGRLLWTTGGVKATRAAQGDRSG